MGIARITSDSMIMFSTNVRVGSFSSIDFAYSTKLVGVEIVVVSETAI
jgi:hypothetical protein